MKNTHRPWTEADDDKLLDLAAKGKTSIMIAAAMRRTTGAITSRLSILRAREKAGRQGGPQAE